MSKQASKLVAREGCMYTAMQIYRNLGINRETLFVFTSRIVLKLFSLLILQLILQSIKVDLQEKVALKQGLYFET